MIKPKDLYETSPEELGLPYGYDKTIIPVSKMRDLLKQCVIRSTDTAHYVLLGIENQANIHYALPIKLMIYDALNYGAQVSAITKEHKHQKDTKNEDEFLSGFRKENKIRPVITLTLYLGSKE